MDNTKKSFGWGDLIIGLLFIIVGFIAFWDPVGDLMGLTVVFGIVAFMKGIYELFFRDAVKQFTDISAPALTVMGILDIIIGVLFLFNLYQGMMLLPYLFAIWIILESIFNLFLLNFYKSQGKGQFWFALIISILSIIIGILLFMDPIVSTLTLSFLVGIYLVWFGILKLMEAFSY